MANFPRTKLYFLASLFGAFGSVKLGPKSELQAIKTSFLAADRIFLCFNSVSHGKQMFCSECE